MRYVLSIVFVLFTLISTAQVEVKERIIMTGATNADRQIKGVGDPTDLGDAVNARTVQRGSLIYAEATGRDTILLNINIPPPNQYIAGMLINFKAENTNTGPVVVNLNNLGYCSLKKGDNYNLDSADIVNQQLITMIYDGTKFQILSPLNKGCPNGFISVNTNYCIEIEERAAASWWVATITCMNKNANLCSMSEWTYACQKSGLGLNNMVNNYEWVNSAANNATTSKTVGLDYQGNPGCDYGSYAAPTALNSYRCCFSK